MLLYCNNKYNLVCLLLVASTMRDVSQTALSLAHVHVARASSRVEWRGHRPCIYMYNIHNQVLHFHFINKLSIE